MFWTCIFLAMKWTISRHIVGYITLNGCKNEGFWKRFTRIFFALIVVFSKNMYLYVLRQKYRSECLAKPFSLYATRILFLLQLNVQKWVKSILCDLKTLKCAFFSDSALIRQLLKLDLRLAFRFKGIKRRKSGLKTAPMKQKRALFQQDFLVAVRS